MLGFAPFHVQGLEIKVWRDYERFIAELTAAFPHEAKGEGTAWRCGKLLRTSGRRGYSVTTTSAWALPGMLSKLPGSTSSFSCRH